MKKIKLYHYTDKNFDTLKPDFFGNNFYTNNDKNVSGIKRSFFYLQKNNFEYRFKFSKYLYIIEVKKLTLYDLKTDNKNLINKFKNLHNLLCYLQKNYLGITYKIGKINYACIFKNIKPVKKIKRH